MSKYFLSSRVTNVAVMFWNDKDAAATAQSFRFQEAFQKYLCWHKNNQTRWHLLMFDCEWPTVWPFILTCTWWEELEHPARKGGWAGGCHPATLVSKRPRNGGGGSGEVLLPLAYEIIDTMMGAVTATMDDGRRSKSPVKYGFVKEERGWAQQSGAAADFITDTPLRAGEGVGG